MNLRTSEKLRISLALAAAALMATACDPCVGNTLCDDPMLDVTGRATVHLTGGPAADIRVEFRSLSGARLTEDTVVTRTDADGVFHLRAPARRSGSVFGELAFLLDPPWEELSYHTEIRLETTRVEGATTFIGSWGVGPLPAAPHIRASGRTVEGSTGEGLAGVTVSFERSGGVEVEPDTFSTVSNEAGEFLIEPLPAGTGSVTGRLRFIPPEPYPESVSEELEIPVLTAQPLRHRLGDFAVDHRLDYEGELLWEDDDSPVEGATVTFRRLSGIEVEPDEFSTSTGADGRFSFDLRPLSAGSVEGEIFAVPPGVDDAVPIPIATVTLETFTEPGPLLAGSWRLERP